jgi:hypothetical protein
MDEKAFNPPPPAGVGEGVGLGVIVAVAVLVGVRVEVGCGVEEGSCTMAAAFVTEGMGLAVGDALEHAVSINRRDVNRTAHRREKSSLAICHLLA